MNARISWLDVKLGIRMLFKHPALTLVGGLGIAVGVAMSVGFFSFAVAYIYPTLPLEEGDRIVALENRDIALNDEDRRALHDFATWREELRSIEHLAAFRTVQHNLITAGGAPEPVHVAEMTAAGFRVGRVPPLHGRYLLEEDERAGATPVVVLGYHLWQNRFNADARIIGREIRLGRTMYTVVGIMPEGFAFPENHRMWTALRASPADYERREGPEIFIFGRLAPGVSMQQAQAELDAIGRRTAAAFPTTHELMRPLVMPYAHSLLDVQGITVWQVGQMQLMMTLLLLVVALNVAVLVYARTATRQGEIAVRSALGASRGRVVGQLFVEALVLSTLAAAAGLLLAQLGIDLGMRIVEAEQAVGTPFWTDFSVRPATVLLTMGLAVLAAVIVGVLPALHTTGRRLQSDLRQLGGASARLGRTWTALIVVQIAIAVAALPAAVNMGWSEIRNAATRPNFPAEEFLVAAVEPSTGLAEGAPIEPGEERTFAERLTDLMRRLDAEPAVAGVTFRGSLAGRTGTIRVEGMEPPAESPFGHAVNTAGVHPSFFDVFAVRIMSGRALEPADQGAGAAAVVVNQAFVRQIMGGESPLGRRIRHVGTEEREGAADAQPARWYEIVGVAQDMQSNSAAPERIRPEVLYPLAPAQIERAALAVHLRGSTPADFGPRLRQVAAEVDPALQLGTIRSLADSDSQQQSAARLVGLAVGLVLLSVLLLSAAGVYALMSFTVTQRRREIGIRAALGANPRQVLHSVFARAAMQIGAGVGVGVATAALLEVATGGGLVGGRGLVLVPALAVLMLMVGILAALGPARRGLRIEPTEALRGDG